MTDRTTGAGGQPVKRDPNVAPDDMLDWLWGQIYDTVNRGLELLYYFIRGVVRWFLMMRESPVAIVGVCLVGFWVLVAAFATFTSYDPNAQDFDMLADPTPAWWLWEDHWLGTDHLGRDLWARLAYGARTVLIIAPIAVATAYFFGCLMGMLAGYLGGWVDMLVSRVSDIILSFPVLILYIIMISSDVLPRTLNIIVAVTLASSPGIGRIVRGMILDLRNREYVDAAKIRGESAIYIMVVELLPNARGPLIVDACVRMGYTIITIGILGFLGLGLPPPDPDWGGMVKDTTAMIVVWPHMSILPCVAISTLVIGFNLLADGLREISMRD